MRLIHDTQILEIHTWERQERADWLFDYLATRNEAYWQLAAQQRAYAVVAAFGWLHYRLGVMRMAQVVIAGLQTRRGQQRELFEIEEAA